MPTPEPGVKKKPRYWRGFVGVRGTGLGPADAKGIRLAAGLLDAIGLHPMGEVQIVRASGYVV